MGVMGWVSYGVECVVSVLVFAFGLVEMVIHPVLALLVVSLVAVVLWTGKSRGREKRPAMDAER